MNLRTLKLFVASAAILASAQLFAYGPHTALDCLGCHDPHYAKAQKIFKVRNELLVNPRTGTKIDDVSALCLGCHNTPQFGGAGIKPIHLHMTHPVNVLPNPRIANVPGKLLRNNMLQCISCHDPHPSNSNWRYLRVDSEQGTKVGRFCQMCHPAKVDTDFYGFTHKTLQVFTSMNESLGAGSLSAWDQDFTVANVTPVYIQAYGEFPNSIAPAYPIVAGMDWIFSPPEDKIPAELKRSLSGQPLEPNEAQLKQQEFNKGTYTEPVTRLGKDAPAPAAPAPAPASGQPAPAPAPAGQ
jgi:predicted CXXCH cytochrome family protein